LRILLVAVLLIAAASSSAGPALGRSAPLPTVNDLAPPEQLNPFPQQVFAPSAGLRGPLMLAPVDRRPRWLPVVSR